MRQWTGALSAEYEAVVEYNSALAGFEFAKGTLLDYDQVTINEGPLPTCVQVRAVEHERDRTRAVVLRERANPVPHPSCSPAAGTSGLPLLPPDGVVSLPALLAGAPATPRDVDFLLRTAAEPPIPSEPLVLPLPVINPQPAVVLPDTRAVLLPPTP